MNSRGESAPGLKRFALVLHYDGGPFHGWQLQRDEPTVQGVVEGVLERLTGERRIVVASGRTDRGVHASGQVASVDLPARWDAFTLRRALNALLPSTVWVEEVRRVPGDFHPRFEARGRSYVYQVGLHPGCRSPFLRPLCWPLERDPPDPDPLSLAATLIPGERSFRAFAKAGQPERGERCRVDAARWTRWTGGLPGRPEEGAPGGGPGGTALGLRFEITADRYLHHMVRYLVGTMVEVARGARPLEEMHRLLEDPDAPLTTSPPAPPEGLFLARVEYPSDRWEGHPERDPP